MKTKDKPTPQAEISKLKGEIRKLTKELRTHTDNVLVYLHFFDALAAKHIHDRVVGRQFTRLASALDMSNDRVRYFVLHLGTSADDKHLAVAQLLPDSGKRK